jgi:hypothetical protein
VIGLYSITELFASKLQLRLAQKISGVFLQRASFQPQKLLEGHVSYRNHALFHCNSCTDLRPEMHQVPFDGSLDPLAEF